MSRMTKSALLHVFALTIYVICLSACAGDRTPKHAEPPQGSIGELRMDAQNRLVLELHLENVSEVSIKANRLSVTLTSDGAAQTFTHEGAITVPMLGGERVLMRADGDSEWLARLGGLERAQELPFELTGELVEESGRVLKLEYDGRLSPTPGKPGSFR